MSSTILFSLIGVATADQTAAQPGDYTQVTATAIVFATGESTKTQMVTTIADSNIEGIETLDVVVSMLTGSNVASGAIDTNQDTAALFILDCSCKCHK